MIRLATPTLVALAIAMGTDIAAQTRAETRPFLGCTAPGPDDFLRTKLTDERIWSVDEDGIAVIEIESVPAVSGWSEETTFSGFTGDSYYRWVGGNFWSQPGNGVLTYRVFVDEPGYYHIRIHNRHNHPDPSLENDCWMRVNGSNWIKTYSNTGSNSNFWNWHFRFDPGHTAVRYPLVRGVNEIQVSGRSNGFMIDRMVVFPTGQNGEDTTLPESERMRERPVIGETMRLVAHDDGNVIGLVPGAAAFSLAAMAGEGPNCGTILPGWSISPTGAPAAGEYLLDSQLAENFVDALPYNGGRLFIDVRIPANPSLVGGVVSVQGAWAQVMNGQFQPVLTRRIELHIGDY